MQSPAAQNTGDAIEVAHATKQFRIHHHGSLKLALINVARKPKIVQFTALNDVTFSVPHGQTVAVVGRNGSGKSTLLSLLARVYLPTSGSVTMRSQRGRRRARVAPLLELGAGFHPDLSGLDNIHFYAAFLGMSAKEIDRNINEIVEFSELGEKVDTLVRGWNDGSRLRLGFAIAVHTDPDILLVDEVLAVGDESFRNKCYARIAQMQAEARTMLVVSHDLPAVERIATRVIWLDHGAIRMDGDANSVLEAYRAAANEPK